MLRLPDDWVWDSWIADDGESTTGPWDVASARPFEAEPALFAAPLVRQRDGGWVLVGFRNTESEGALSFEITAPIPVAVRDGGLVAAVPADELPELGEGDPL